MRNKLGIFIIMFTFILTLVFWTFVQPTSTIPRVMQYSQLIASIALVGFAWINFISTRNHILDKLFQGLDKSYIYHKYLSISMLVLIIIHDLTIKMGKSQEIASGIKIPKDPYAMYGSFSMYLFVALIFIALVAKKLNYERWKTIHKFMFLPYAMGIYHYYGSANYTVFGLSGYSLWMNAINVLGICSVVYSIVFYEKIGFRYKYKISKLQTVSTGTLEITGEAIGEFMDFKPGQFAFIKVAGVGNKFPSHPFTISEAPRKGEIQFTIKALGDHTRQLAETVKVGDEFKVSGPYGHFNYETGSKNQIWIAGGIGVTPFRSFCQAGILDIYNIDFFYAYNNEEDGAYVEELEKLVENKSNVHLHLFNAKEVGFLSAEQIIKYVNKENHFDVYFCGPKPMREALRGQFKNGELKVLKFNFEHFQFK